MISVVMQNVRFLFAFIFKSEVASWLSGTNEVKCQGWKRFRNCHSIVQTISGPKPSQRIKCYFIVYLKCAFWLQKVKYVLIPTEGNVPSGTLLLSLIKKSRDINGVQILS